MAGVQEYRGPGLVTATCRGTVLAGGRTWGSAPTNSRQSVRISRDSSGKLRGVGKTHTFGVRR